MRRPVAKTECITDFVKVSRLHPVKSRIPILGTPQQSTYVGALKNGTFKK
jgi:hypothetical protein